jgi:glyoxylate/hydroxypyruvate reductase A
MIPLICTLPEAYQQAWLKLLSEALPNERFVLPSTLEESERADCEIAIVANPETQVLKTFPSLIWVQSLWAGVENLIDVSAEQGFKIVRLVDSELAVIMSEAVLAWTLYLHRKMPTYAAQQKEKIWNQLVYSPPAECKVGILGLGELGQTSALRLADNGFHVMGWSRNAKEIENVESFCGEQGLQEMLQRCQILVCLLPLTEQTREIINIELLTQLPKDASLINFARGPLVAIDALLQALDEGNLYHAVLDVFNQEPLEAESRFWDHPRVTVLPHITAATHPESAIKTVTKNILDYRKTGKLNLVVDIERGY